MFIPTENSLAARAWSSPQKILRTRGSGAKQNLRLHRMGPTCSPENRGFSDEIIISLEPSCKDSYRVLGLTPLLEAQLIVWRRLRAGFCYSRVGFSTSCRVLTTIFCRLLDFCGCRSNYNIGQEQSLGFRHGVGVNLCPVVGVPSSTP